MEGAHTEPRRVCVRSYRLVTDELERRLFKVDRYRLPLPYGVPLRSLGYFAAALGAFALIGSLPVLGAVFGLLPASVRWLALPLAVSVALTQVRLDGRPPHVALVGWARFALRPKHIAGLRPSAPVGQQLAPVHRISMSPTGGEAGYRAGRVRGPATVRLRYPAAVSARGLIGSPATAEGLAGARRLRVSPLRGSAALVATELRVPEGRELEFRT